ncbi:hypothetical protein [Galbibacter sp.]|uniref:hypothetical protein n=1 Tax=Galbibacter sp. TaxID=2918471 RepID=UPI003A91C130
MNKEEITAKIRAKQELINLEDEQTRKNELMQDIRVLQMRLDMDDTHEKIKKLTNRD